MTASQPSATCPQCGAPVTDHGGIVQCTADVTHIDVYDLAAITGPVMLRRRPGDGEPRPRPAGLTPGERDAIGWARTSSAAQRDKGRGMADALRHDLAWMDDTELARIALYFGMQLELVHKWGWPELGPAELAEMLKAAAVDLAAVEMADGPGWPQAGDPQGTEGG